MSDLSKSLQRFGNINTCTLEPAKWPIIKTNCGIKGFSGIFDIFLQLYSDTRKRPSQGTTITQFIQKRDMSFHHDNHRYTRNKRQSF